MVCIKRCICAKYLSNLMKNFQKIFVHVMLWRTQQLLIGACRVGSLMEFPFRRREEPENIKFYDYFNYFCKIALCNMWRVFPDHITSHHVVQGGPSLLFQGSVISLGAAFYTGISNIYLVISTQYDSRQLKGVLHPSMKISMFC